MRRIPLSVVAALVALTVLAAPMVAAAPPTRGILPANARIHGHTLTDLATAWNEWAWTASPDDSAILDVRCEQSEIDPKVWFLPVSLGGEWETTCAVPAGSFLVMSPGALECSSVEPEPFFGADPEDLQACVDEGFELLTYVEVTVDGRTVTDLGAYVLTANLIDLPPNNLLSADPGISLTKGYFLVFHPLSRGTHTLRAYDEFAPMEFTAGITYTIVVE
jgi:hypothetical protein